MIKFQSPVIGNIFTENFILLEQDKKLPAWVRF